METLIRVNLLCRRNGYKFFLLVWAQDALDAIGKLNRILTGPDGEYQIIGATPQREDGKTVIREWKGRAAHA